MGVWSAWLRVSAASLTTRCNAAVHSTPALCVLSLRALPPATQAKAVQEHIRANDLKVDVVIVSPLTRALETAVGCFGNFAQPSNGTPPLMMEISEQPGVRAAHPAVSSEGCPPFIAYELCREHLGVHPCDRRHTISQKQGMFPGAQSLCV